MDTTKLAALIDLVGELVISESMVVQDPELLKSPSPNLARNLGQLRRITSELQRTAMSLRMVPIKATFQKMTRLVRVAGGKPALGTIHLRAFHQGGNIVIQIQDDGTASSSSPATRRAACSWTSSSANRKSSSNRSAVRSKRTLRSPAAPCSATVAWASSRMWTRS